MKEPLVSRASEDRKAPKVFSHLEIKHAENGGHIVENHFEHYDHKPEPHVFSSSEGNEAVAHIAQAAGIKWDAPQAENETGGHIPDEK